LSLTLSVPHFPGCGKNESTKASTSTLLIFWHLGTLAPSPDRQSAWMSKN